MSHTLENVTQYSIELFKIWQQAAVSLANRMYKIGIFAHSIFIKLTVQLPASRALRRSTIVEKLGRCSGLVAQLCSIKSFSCCGKCLCETEGKFGLPPLSATYTAACIDIYINMISHRWGDVIAFSHCYNEGFYHCNGMQALSADSNTNCKDTAVTLLSSLQSNWGSF